MEPLEVPDKVPVMTLPNTVFFPQALLPLHIFEPRYVEMLKHVLAGNRIFAVARLKQPSAKTAQAVEEPSYDIATIGIIRACQEASDNTANLLLQGISRITIRSTIQ